MANNNPDLEVANTQADTNEPDSAAAPRRSASESQKTSSTIPVASAPPLRKQPSNTSVPLSPSAGASPRTSRNASPTRKDSRPQPLSNPISTQPSAAAIQRALSAANVPSIHAGGVSDAVSKLPKPPKSAGGSGDTTPRWPTSPRLKSPPPSTSNSRRGSTATQKKAEVGTAPSINIQNATPQTSTPSPATPKQGGDETSKTQPQLQTTVKSSSRGPSGKSTLETVQENSADDTKDPSPAAIQAAADLRPLTKISDDESQSTKQGGAAAAENEKHTQHGESGSESAGTKIEVKKDQSSTAPRPKNAHTKSYNPLASTKSRQQEGKQNMTVETETVASIPQSALSVGDRPGGTRNNESGSVRTKPSNETIRPKKERKKPTQKARSINQSTGAFLYPKSPLLIQQAYFKDTPDDDSGSGSSRSSSTVREASCSDPMSPTAHERRIPYSERLGRGLSFCRSSHYIRSLSNKYLRKASSKADIFEARVASAVDEANSSDSDETFVYESNPPDPQRRARHHSRTPSVTSSHSVAEAQRSAGLRNFGDVLDERRIAGKRSMKFSNSIFNDTDSPESKDGSVRSHQPRHFGRFGRGGSQASMFDQDSPFTQASKLRSNQLNMRHSRPNSPRSPLQQQKTSGLFGKKQEPSFDFDAEGGDDERAPLMGTVRTPRSSRLPRRLHSSAAQSIDEYYGVRRHSRCGRFGGCLLGFVVLAAAILSAVAFLVMSNRPMYEVKIHRIQNVLASEQELMLDLLVGAVNPNALGISIDEMNIDIFAKSKHVDNDELLLDRAYALGAESDSRLSKRRRRSKRRRFEYNVSSKFTASDGVDEGTDPDDDLDRDSQTMLLGRIFEFDQGLNFEGSPLKRHLHYSVGELRLEKPGNKTETGGSKRWESILQYPFELIIRGVLKYHLPISSRLETAAVGASILVHPEDDVDEFGNMRVEEIDHSEHWQWIDWDDLGKVFSNRIEEVEDE